jgi:cytoskeletal protein RodZ
MTSQEVFIGRLRRYRERSGIPIAEIAALTNVKRDLLEAFERNDLSGWPRGVYARAWVRAYASVVGLDPIDTVDEFCRLFPQGDRRVARIFQDMSAIVGHQSEYQDPRPADAERRRGAPRVNMLPAPPWHVAVMHAVLAWWTRTRLNIRPARRRIREEAAGSLR